MSIQYTCACGALIRLPAAATGRKAKCKSCGTIFRVPEATALAPPSGQVPAAAAPAKAGRAPQAHGERADDWLLDFADSETRATGEPVRVVDLTPPPLVQEDDRPGQRFLDAQGARPAEDRDWIIAPQRSFWADLAASFFFFLNGSSLVTFIVISFVAMWDALVSYAPGFLSLMGHALINGYLCAFYMNVIRETASGEDELPGVSVTSVLDDILFPLAQFIGTWAVALAPAVITLVLFVNSSDELTALHAMDPSLWPGVVYALGVVGLALWPVIVLGVAIGGGFNGLWPHVIIRTALGAPLAYLAILAALIVATAFMMLPWFDFFGLRAANLPIGAIVGLALVSIILGEYSAIVSMRVIGLFYRHFKHRFPWVAE
ncbi:MAG: hypothetical protein AMXMBFR13_13810 [Phycisphaerae bacterium]